MIFFRQRVGAIQFSTAPEISWPNNTGHFQAYAYAPATCHYANAMRLRGGFTR